MLFAANGMLVILILVTAYRIWNGVSHVGQRSELKTTPPTW